MKKMRWVNSIAFCAMLLMNALANLIPLGGHTTGQVSAKYPNLFTPAPITFAIWGVIYLLVAVCILYQWEVLDHGRVSAQVRESIGAWFAASCAFNMLWLLFWHIDAIELSLIAMGGLLFTLFMIESNLNELNLRVKHKLVAKAGFDIYTGWIIAASIANISVWLVKIGWNRFGLPEEFWTMVVLLVGAGIACITMLLGKIPLAGLSVIWAYTGILIKHFSRSGFAGAYPFAIFAAFIGIIGMGIVFTLTVKQQYPNRTAQ